MRTIPGTALKPEEEDSHQKREFNLLQKALTDRQKTQVRYTQIKKLSCARHKVYKQAHNNTR